MPLTNTAVSNAKPKEKGYKMTDEKGLFLFIHPSGGKYWRFKYRFAGKEKLLALGVYPEVSLAAARDKRTQARAVIDDGNDPAQMRKETKRQEILSTGNTFEGIAREWHKRQAATWSENYAGKVMDSLENDVFPKLGLRPLKNISAPELLDVLRVIEGRGAIETAHRVKQVCGQVFMYGIATSRAERNPAADLQKALTPSKPKHYAHLKAIELPEFLRRLDAYDGNIQTRLAIKLLMTTFVRTIELRGATWGEINFDAAQWRIPKERMKMKREHIVPLSAQAILILREVQKYTGNRDFIFPNQHKPMLCMSENTLLYALYRMGYHGRATGHGFRSTASTILNENGFTPDVIERQLAHLERSAVRAAYNHAEYLPQRREMMQWWADYLDKAKAQQGQLEGA